MNKFIMLLALLFLVGCSGLDLRDPVQRVGVQYAIGKAIEASDDPVKLSNDIISEAEQFKSFLAVQAVPITEIRDRVRQRIIDKGYSPADTVLAIAVLDTVELEISKAVESGRIPPDKTTSINAFLDLVINVAGWYATG